MQVQKHFYKQFSPSHGMRFIIPVYQRNYDWRKDNCKQLFDDIKNISNTRNGTHFIGTVCTKISKNYHDIIVIDGQQRITSIALLFKAMYDLTDDEFLKRNISSYLVDDYQKDKSMRIKLKPIKKDEFVFQKLIDATEHKDSDFTQEELDSNIMTNYHLFKELLREGLNNKDFTLEEFFDATQRLEIVEIQLDNENPQAIFESLNSTGLDLTNTDLLRNYLLMSLDYEDQEELYQKYWLKIEEDLGSANIEQFMVHYLIFKQKSDSITVDGKRGHITNKTLYYAFKKFYSNLNRQNKDDVELFFKDLYKYSQYYKNFIFTGSEVPKEGTLKRKFYDIFCVLEEKDASILVVYLIDLFNEDSITDKELMKLLDIIITFAVRAMVCGRAGFNKQLTASVVQKLDGKPFTTDNFWLALTSGNGKYSLPRDKEFREMLTTKELYKSLSATKCNYLLYRIDLCKNPKECLDFKSGTIEHILPQSFEENNAWRDYLNSKRDIPESKLLLHTLGNLTLTGYNSEMSDKMFEEKKKVYKESNYGITRQLAQESEWTSKQIKQRATELAECCVTEVFPVDPRFCKEQEVDTGVVYTLDADLKAFTYTKPLKFSFYGEEFDIPNWKDLLKITVKKLYNLDKDVFLQLTKSPNLPGGKAMFREVSDDDGRYYEVAPKLYVDTCNSAELTLRFVKFMIDFFDKALDLDIADEVWFTLKKV